MASRFQRIEARQADQEARLAALEAALLPAATDDEDEAFSALADADQDGQAETDYTQPANDDAGPGDDAGDKGSEGKK